MLIEIGLIAALVFSPLSSILMNETVPDTSNSSVTSESGGEDYELPTPGDVLVTDSSYGHIPDIDDFVSPSDAVLEDEEMGVALLVVTGGTYAGALPAAAAEYFRGVLSHRSGIPYVAFRATQYSTYLFYGDGLRYDGSRFTGSGNYVLYNTQNSTTLSFGADTLDLVPGTGFVWTNMDDKFAQFEAEVQLLNAKTILFGIACLLCFLVFCRILFRRRA